MGFDLRHRRPAECRQVDPLQRADRDRGGGGGELSVLHDRAECRPRRRARRAARQARAHRQVGEDRSRPSSTSSTSPAWCAAPARARASATSSSANIREVDAIAHVLRCFEGDVTHVEGSVDPLRDAETVETELMLADLDSLERRLHAAQKSAKGGDRGGQGAARGDGAGRWPLLREGKPARGFKFRAGAQAGLEAAAAPDAEAGALCLQCRGELGRRRQRATRSSSPRRPRPKAPQSVVISAAIEAEVAQLAPSEDRPRHSSTIWASRRPASRASSAPATLCSA